MTKQRVYSRHNSDYKLDYLIKEVAKRASFTLMDTEVIVRTVRDVIHDMIRDEKNFYWPQLFTLRVKPIKEHRRYNIITKKLMYVKTKRIIFSPVMHLRKLIKNGTVSIPMTEEEYAEFLRKEKEEKENPLEN